jgi:hypothetical protein
MQGNLPSEENYWRQGTLDLKFQKKSQPSDDSSDERVALPQIEKDLLAATRLDCPCGTLYLDETFDTEKLVVEGDWTACRKQVLELFTYLLEGLPCRMFPFLAPELIGQLLSILKTNSTTQGLGSLAVPEIVRPLQKYMRQMFGSSVAGFWWRVRDVEFKSGWVCNLSSQVFKDPSRDTLFRWLYILDHFNLASEVFYTLPLGMGQLTCLYEYDSELAKRLAFSWALSLEDESIGTDYAALAATLRNDRIPFKPPLNSKTEAWLVRLLASTASLRDLQEIIKMPVTLRWPELIAASLKLPFPGNLRGNSHHLERLTWRNNALLELTTDLSSDERTALELILFVRLSKSLHPRKLTDISTNIDRLWLSSGCSVEYFELYMYSAIYGEHRDLLFQLQLRLLKAHPIQNWSPELKQLLFRRDDLHNIFHASFLNMLAGGCERHPYNTVIASETASLLPSLPKALPARLSHRQLAALPSDTLAMALERILLVHGANELVQEISGPSSLALGPSVVLELFRFLVLTCTTTPIGGLAGDGKGDLAQRWNIICQAVYALFRGYAPLRAKMMRIFLDAPHRTTILYCCETQGLAVNLFGIFFSEIGEDDSQEIFDVFCELLVAMEADSKLKNIVEQLCLDYDVEVSLTWRQLVRIPAPLLPLAFKIISGNSFATSIPDSLPCTLSFPDLCFSLDSPVRSCLWTLYSKTGQYGPKQVKNLVELVPVLILSLQNGILANDKKVLDCSKLSRVSQFIASELDLGMDLDLELELNLDSDSGSPVSSKKHDKLELPLYELYSYWHALNPINFMTTAPLEVVLAFYPTLELFGEHLRYIIQSSNSDVVLMEEEGHGILASLLVSLSPEMQSSILDRITALYPLRSSETLAESGDIIISREAIQSPYKWL